MKRRQRSWEESVWLNILREQNKKHVLRTNSEETGVLKFAYGFRMTKEIILDFTNHPEVIGENTQYDYIIENIEGRIVITQVNQDHPAVLTNKEKRQQKITLEKLAQFVPLENLDTNHQTQLYRALQVTYNTFGVVQVPTKQHNGGDIKFSFPMKYVLWSELVEYCKTNKQRGDLIHFDLSTGTAVDTVTSLVLSIEYSL
jgi:hypothetical protein